MSEPEPSRLWTARKLAIAAGAVVLVVGAGAVYASGAWSGNALSGQAAGIDKTATTASVTKSGDCAAAKKPAEALKPYAKGEVAAMSPADDPRSMRALSFTDADGEPMSLADFSGKTLVVNMWATWCVPCRAEMPALDKLDARLGGPDFQVVGINVDTGDPNNPVKFLERIGVTHVKLHRDSKMKAFNTLKSQGLAFGLPSTLLVGKNGCLLGSMSGPAEWNSADAANLVKAAVRLQSGS